MTKVVLYDFPGSPCARRVRITLLEKGIPFERRIVDLTRMEQKHPAYLALNPNGVVPTLVHGDDVIYESNVITEFLEDVYPEPALYPSDPWERAQVKEWQHFELSFAKEFRPLMYQRVIGPVLRLTCTLDQALERARRSTTDPAELAWETKVYLGEVLSPEDEAQTAQTLYARLDTLEKALKDRPFLLGSTLTQADISVFPRVELYALVQLPIESHRYPNVVRWMKRVSERPSFARTLSLGERRSLSPAALSSLRWLREMERKPEEQRTFAERLRKRALKAFLSIDTRRIEVRLAKMSPDRSRPIAKPPAKKIETPPRVSPPTDLVLYEDSRVPEALRVRLLLEELELPYERRPIDAAAGEHLKKGVLPGDKRSLPVLAHGDRILCGDEVIAEYVLASFASPAASTVLSDDPLPRARARMWVAFDRAMHKEFSPLFLDRVLSPHIEMSTLERLPSSAEIALELQTLKRAGSRALLTEDEAMLLAEHLRTKLPRVEAALGESPWLGGSEFGWADVALFTRLRLFSALGVDLNGFPRVETWLNRIEDRPSVAKCLAASTPGDSGARSLPLQSTGHAGGT